MHGTTMKRGICVYKITLINKELHVVLEFVQERLENSYSPLV